MDESMLQSLAKVYLIQDYAWINLNEKMIL